jgi:hypothetical protein
LGTCPQNHFSHQAAPARGAKEMKKIFRQECFRDARGSRGAAMAYVNKPHLEHPDGGTVCDHKNTYSSTTKKKDEVTCLECKSILSGKFGGKPIQRPWL